MSAREIKNANLDGEIVDRELCKICKIGAKSITF